MDADWLSEVAGLIYDAALDPLQWPALLQRMSTLFASTFADSFQRTEDYRQFSGVAYGLDERDYQDVFLGVWVKNNVWGTRRPVRRAGDVVSTREMASPKDLRRSAMYQDYLGPRGLHEGLRLDVWAGEGWIEDISLLRPWSLGPYTPTERAMAHTLLPHLRRSTAVARRLREAGSLAAAGLEAMDQIGAAVLLLDRLGRLVHRNRAGAAMLASGDGLGVSPLGLVASSLAANQQLQAAIAAASAQPGRAGSAVLPRPSGQPPLSVTVLPLSPDLQVSFMARPGAPAVLVSITEPQAGPAALHPGIAQLFGLTAAEAALAARLMAGSTLQEVSAERGRSIATVRSQLAGLLSKTQTRRQTELVALLIRLHMGTVGS